MGKTDRCPLRGSKVERDPGGSRTALTDFFKKSLLPRRISAKHISLAAFIVCACVVAAALSAARSGNTVANAADILIGVQPELYFSPSDGAGRYSESLILSAAKSGNAEKLSEQNDAAPAEYVLEKSDGNDGRYTVTFEFYGRESISCSAEKSATVGELADKMGIDFNETDVLNVPADTVIAEDTVVTTDTVTYGVVSVSSEIEYSTQYIDTESLLAGTSNVVQEGVNGEKITEYECTYVNGVEVSRTEKGSYISKNPTDKIIYRGCGVAKAAENSDIAPGAVSNSSGTFVGGDGKTYCYSGYIDVKATVYYSGGITATGALADESVIAVDPSVIPLGTKVYITGSYADIGVRTAADTGGFIKGNIIDIWVDPSSPLAGGFGFRTMRVYILD